MTVIAFPDGKERCRRRVKPHRLEFTDCMDEILVIDVTPAGLRCLRRCRLFEGSGHADCYEVGSCTAARLIRDGLVVGTFDDLSRSEGVCLTPLGRLALAKLDGKPPGDAA